jgi:hypothetical protein
MDQIWPQHKRGLKMGCAAGHTHEPFGQHASERVFVSTGRIEWTKIDHFGQKNGSTCWRCTKMGIYRVVGSAPHMTPADIAPLDIIFYDKIEVLVLFTLSILSKCI